MEHQLKCKCKSKKIGKRAGNTWLCPHNNLTTSYPKIKIYWSEENEYKPEDYTHGSGKKCLLKCGDDICGGVTIIKILNMVHRNGFVCSKCKIRWGIFDPGEISIS